jgi:hypothetical protein
MENGVWVSEISILSFMQNNKSTGFIDMKDIEDFLDNYILIESEKNFFEIAKLTRKENVSSNVLSFLFKFPLVLKLFLNCVRSTNSGKPHGINYDISNDKIDDIIREESTEENKRIDIVVKTNKYIIGIENKIDAPQDNDFQEYKSYLEKIAITGKKDSHLIVLLLSKDKPKVDLYILYKDFSVELKKNYSELLYELGYRYFFLLTEYVSNIDFLEGEYSMNKDFVEIAKKPGNIAKIQQIMLEGEGLIKALNEMASDIINDLREDSKLFAPSLYTKSKEFWAITKFQSGILSTEKGTFTICVDVLVKISGFTISIYECKDFKKIEILNKILPEFEIDDRGDGLRAYYKNIEFEEYGELIKILKKIFTEDFKNWRQI